MKLAIVSVFVLYALIEASSGQVVVGTLMAVQSTPIDCLAADYGFKCSTCTTANLCDGDKPLTTITCSSPEPYCDTVGNRCTSDKPSTPCATSTFKCPGEGYFPNAQNCDMYYFCTADNTVEEYQCPTNYVFDITIKGCKRLVYSADCLTMKCTKANDYLVYPKDLSIYMHCDSTLTGRMFKCPTSQEFDKTVQNQRCVFKCKREGYYAGSTKSDAYFCYKQGVTFTYTTVKCPTGYEFNESFSCIKSPVVPTTP